MFGKTRYNFWLDATIFVAFLITAITGLLLWLVVPHEQGSQTLLLELARRTWVAQVGTSATPSRPMTMGTST